MNGRDDPPAGSCRTQRRRTFALKYLPEQFRILRDRRGGHVAAPDEGMPANGSCRDPTPLQARHDFGFETTCGYRLIRQLSTAGE